MIRWMSIIEITIRNFPPTITCVSFTYVGRYNSWGEAALRTYQHFIIEVDEEKFIKIFDI